VGWWKIELEPKVFVDVEKLMISDGRPVHTTE
jgi:hypothetical protein